ncbi:MAG: PstC family ABC transporter permease, partial [Sedimentitalea sp.]
MPVTWLFLILLALAGLGFFAGRAKALQSAGGDRRVLHSLPAYYGYNVALTGVIPALGVLVIWLLVQPFMIENRISTMISADMVPEGGSQSLVMSDVRRVAEGLDVAVAQGVLSAQAAANLNTDVTDVRAVLGDVGVALGADVRAPVLAAAQRYRVLTARAALGMTLVVLGLAVAGLAYAYVATHKDFRARNRVEQGVLALLIMAAMIAIMTTLGIVFSMLFETVNFFGLHAWRDFFFGGTWAPNFRGDSELSILPLLWGTIYISIVALLVAVPIGLFAAIYLSEYASNTVRSFAKPLLEILAGIPTIVYGLFA